MRPFQVGAASPLSFPPRLVRPQERLRAFPSRAAIPEPPAVSAVTSAAEHAEVRRQRPTRRRETGLCGRLPLVPDPARLRPSRFPSPASASPST